MPIANHDRQGPLAARGLLAAAVFVGVWLAAAAPSSPGPGDGIGNGRAKPDLDLYRSEIARVGQGEPYYAVACDELIARGYPTRSVFNWRTPGWCWFLSLFPRFEYARVLLRVLAVAVIVLACLAIRREGEAGTLTYVATVLLMLGPLSTYAVGEMGLMPDAWSGVLVALSVTAFGADRRRLGVVAGVAALFLRELALPYCVLAVVLALRERRRHEAAALGVGLALWACFLAWHAAQVAAAMPLDGRAHAESWIQFGGAEFVLRTLRVDIFLFLLPGWVTGLYFTAAMVGLIDWRTAWAERLGLTLMLYVVAYAVAGQPFNFYWGFMVAPLYGIAVARSGKTLRGLVTMARGERKTAHDVAATIA